MRSTETCRPTGDRIEDAAGAAAADGTGASDAAQVVDKLFAAVTRYIAVADSQSDAGMVELAAMLHPEVVIRHGPNLPWSGEWTGLDQVLRLFTIQSRAWKSMTLAKDRIFVHEDGLALTVVETVTSRATGWQFNSAASHVILLRDGLVHDWTVFAFDALMLTEMSTLPVAGRV